MEKLEAAYLNIVVSEKGLSEFSGGKRIIFIPKEKVQNIQIHFGSAAERPLLQIIAGIMLMGLGCVGLFMMEQSGMRGLRWGLGFLVFGGFGLWFLHETFTKSHYLRVICHNDSRKLVFRGAFEESEFSKFVAEAAKCGYTIENCVSKQAT